MADIIASIDPGQYTGSQTLTITFPPNTRKAIITKDDRPPVLTEILAYDRGYILPIPSNPDPSIGEGPIVDRPFLAATQDGRGNVTYDGGFPKFYNSHIRSLNGGTYPPTLPTTLAGLPPACKYFLNALKFIANPRKVAQGNRKILFLNNTFRNGQYNILKSHYKPDPLQNNDGADGFRDTFDAVCNIGGWIPTYYDLTTQGDNQPLNMSLATMEQYAAIVFLASRGENRPGESWISATTSANLAQYRYNGSGLTVITDHCGANYSDLQDAVTNGSIFGGDATKVTQHFGAYFSGDVARRPVLVGEIREQIGIPGYPEDHPLLEGMSDDEYIFAGGSESMIVPELFENDLVDPNSPWVTNMNTAGTYRFNVLIQLDDGTIVTRPLRYIIINPSDINIRDSFNNIVQPTHTTYMQVVDYRIDGGQLQQVLNGKVEVDGKLVSWFKATPTNGNWSEVYYPLGGENTPILVNTGQTVKWTITDPFEYSISRVINIPDPNPYWVASGSVSTFNAKVAGHPFFTGKSITEIYNNILGLTNKYYTDSIALGNSIPNMWWKQIGKARCAFGKNGFIPVNVRVYATPSAWSGANVGYGSIGDSALIASDNTIYYWDDFTMTWIKHASKAPDLFGIGRTVVNKIDSSKWIINASNTTKV